MRELGQLAGPPRTSTIEDHSDFLALLFTFARKGQRVKDSSECFL
jgi:hypothetical protein